jgi:hypothetical protein
MFWQENNKGKFTLAKSDVLTSANSSSSSAGKQPLSEEMAQPCEATIRTWGLIPLAERRRIFRAVRLAMLARKGADVFLG